MNILMKLKGYKKCRLWINEIIDDRGAEVEKTIEKSLSAGNKKYGDKLKLAIELAFPKNNSNYAFIGFEYVPDELNKDITSVIVCLNNKSICYSKETLAKPNDKVFKGISEEYGNTILDTAIETINEMNCFSSGKIIFNIGAYAECGSSKAIFAQATKILLNISQLELMSMSDLVIQEKIESML